MAIFNGDKEEFKKFFGGYCRNKVLAITRSERQRYNNKCACCGNTAELQAAHHRGFERIKVIELILDEKFKSDNTYSVDLNEFEQLFIDRHLPISRHFFFLCPSCHKKYDLGLICEKDIKVLPDEKNTSNYVSNKSNNHPLQRRKSQISNNIKYEFNDKEDLYRCEDETIQQYIKRLLHLLFDNKMISEDLIKQLQNKNYCKTTFDLEYPLLEQDEGKIRPSGRNRYYTTWKLDNTYYVCSQWWKDNFAIYDKKLRSWVEKFIVSNNL